MRADPAALVGASRESATEALGDLADRGPVRLGRGRTSVLDREGLTVAAGDQRPGARADRAPGPAVALAH